MDFDTYFVKMLKALSRANIRVLLPCADDGRQLPEVVIQRKEKAAIINVGSIKIESMKRVIDLVQREYMNAENCSEVH